MLASRFSIDGDSRIGLPQCWQEITRIFTRTGAATMETPALWRPREVQLNATNLVCREFESTLPARISFGSALFRRQFRPHRGNVRLSPEASQRTRVTRIVSTSEGRSRRIPGSNWYVMAECRSTPACVASSNLAVQQTTNVRVQLPQLGATPRPTASNVEALIGCFGGFRASKGIGINRVYGAGDGNRTHVRSLGS